MMEDGRMNIVTRISELKDLTSNEQILVDYLLTETEKVVNLRSNELATELFISVATIYRLINKLGLSGFGDLKIQLISSLRERNEKKEINYDYPIIETDTPYDVTQNIKGIYTNTIDEMIHYFDHQSCIDIVERLKRADVIDVYASSANVYFAENFQFQMQEIGILVNVPLEGYVQELSAANSDQSHVAIVISYGGRGKATKDVVRILNENKIDIILITSLQDNPLTEFAQYKLYLASAENHYHKISSFSTRLSLLYIFDVLYSIYFNQDYEKNLAFKLRNYQKMNKELK